MERQLRTQLSIIIGSLLILAGILGFLFRQLWIVPMTYDICLVYLLSGAVLVVTAVWVDEQMARFITLGVSAVLFVLALLGALAVFSRISMVVYLVVALILALLFWKN